ncbi:ribosomal protein L6e-domain-containing protein [Chytriomyces cf. hyalinus JEL632]|nr:ribosomal protein L6e-domain-containing protein [Chytriomyces cf. hyalinus JEL632]
MTKNPALIPGVATLSRSSAFKNKGLFNRKKAASAKQAAPVQTLVKKVGGAKNGGSRTVPVQRIAKFYPAEDVPKNKVTRKTIRPAVTRSSITPGTVLILVAGRFAGKRVVFLKTLDSGLLLVSGPFKINGVPLRRVNQAFVIATSAKVDIGKVKIPATVNDAYFKAGKEAKSKATDAALFDASVKKTVDAARVADQKSVDAAIIAAVKKTPLLKAYLNASFALSKGQAPHLIKY